MHLTDLNSMETPGCSQPHSSVLQFSSSPPESWLQSPPTQMPWGVSQPPLVRFTAELPVNGIVASGSGDTRYVPQGCMSHVPSSFTQSMPTFSQTTSMNSMSYTPNMTPMLSQVSVGVAPPCLKRKLDAADDAEMLCAVNKLHISEERMVSHQQGVHALFQLASEAVRSVNEIPKGRRIKLSEEVQQFPMQEPILPQPLLDRMRRPSNALVLWQPPRPLSSAVIATSTSSSEEDEDQDNNNSSSLDLNNMPSFSDPSRPPPPVLGDEGDIDMEAL